MLALLCLPGLAAAGGQALVEVSAPPAALLPLRIEYREDRVRLQAEGEGAFLLLREGQIESIAAPRVPTDVALAGGNLALDPPRGLPPFELGLDAVARFVSLDDSGREEAVAGLPGRVHLLSYRDAEGQLRREALVLSRDPRVRELTRALQRLAQAAAQDAPQTRAPGACQLADELAARRVGVLRLGSRFRVLRLEEGEPALARFERPPTD